MRITIITIGSRGDVQPYVALALGFARAGHSVRVATHTAFEHFVREHGLDFAPVEGNPQALLLGEAGQAWLESGSNPFRFVRDLLRLARPLLESLLADTWRACQGADAIIYSALAFPAVDVAEKLRVPGYLAVLQPLGRTRTFPMIATPPGWRLGGAYNLLTHVLAEQLSWQPVRRLMNGWRRDTLGLRPRPMLGPFARLRRQGRPVLYGYSPAVVPKPADWPAAAHVTGYWFLDRPAGWQPPADLLAFLAAGAPPVYIGFGSMVGRDPARLTGQVLDALAQTGQRAILLTGWGGLAATSLPDSVFCVATVPHDWLFPRLAAVVHHGGAGTTGAGLRAGVPSILAPFFADQPFWGQRVAALGVGPAPIPQKELTAERLAAAIRQAVQDPVMRRRAAALGARIRGEDGVARAVAVVEATLPRGRARRAA